MKRRHQSSLALVVATSLLGLSPQAMAKDLRVAYAGSMGAVMDRHLGPTFAKAHNVQYQGEGQGAYGLAHLIAAHKLRTRVAGTPPRTSLVAGRLAISGACAQCDGALLDRHRYPSGGTDRAPFLYRPRHGRGDWRNGRDW